MAAAKTRKTTRKKTARKASARKTAAGKKKSGRRWSGRVSRESDALDLKKGVFTWKDPKRIARSLKRSAEHSHRRKSSPYRSAMSMLTFYVNRGGKICPPARRRCWKRPRAN